MENINWKKVGVAVGSCLGAYLIYNQFKTEKCPSDYKEPAQIRCNCGGVEINVRGNTRTAIECCCCDCRQKIEWAISKGAPIDP